jgi:hypothetical protein
MKAQNNKTQVLVDPFMTGECVMGVFGGDLRVLVGRSG